MKTKKCSKCNQMKPLQEFYRKRSTLDGRAYLCKKCAKSYHKAYYKAHSTYLKEYNKAYYKTHCEKMNNANKVWYAKHPEEARLIRFAYDQKRRSGRGTVGVETLRQVLTRDGAICHLCGQLVMPEQISFDHVIPISLGGNNSKANLRVAHKYCNSARRNKSIIQFRREHKLLLKGGKV